MRADAGHPAPRSDRLVDDLGVLEARAQDRDLALEQPLLVLCRVVFEVLGEIAVAARGRDRLDDPLPARALKLRKLALELLALGARELLRHGEAQLATSAKPTRPLLVGIASDALVATAAGAAAASAAAAEARLAARTVHRERGELLAHVRRRAIGTDDDLVAADELLEVRLALHADVLVDR